MKSLFHTTLLQFFFIGLFLSACEEENNPSYLTPIVAVNEAEDVTRTTATISGSIQTLGTEEVTTIQFRYGTTTENMPLHITCTSDNLHPNITLTKLTPNTTYYYCLEVGNGYSIVKSTTQTFTTLPNRTPVISNLQMLNQGPLSITLSYELLDDGGEPIVSAGFYYKVKNGKEKKQIINITTLPTLSARISGLQEQTDYTVQAFATNSIGETRSESFTFHTSQAIVLTTPGSLSEAIDEYEKYLYTTLNIAGPLNGTDLRFLREMLGRDVNGNATPGQLEVLDMTDATICAGGLTYDGYRYTEDNSIGMEMFAHSSHLQKLVLPSNIIAVEKNAFKECRELVSIRVPSTTTRILPSEDCLLLTAVEIAEENKAFSSTNGIVYNKKQTELIWVPAGIDKEISLHSSMESIGEYALCNYPKTKIDLPGGIKEIKNCAFANARLTSITLPDQVEHISYGLFQQCQHLESITLGKQTSYLSEYCFEGCPLKHLYIQTTDLPPMCQDATFSQEQLNTCVLHIPAGCDSLYKESSHWGRFKTIVEE